MFSVKKISQSQKINVNEYFSRRNKFQVFKATSRGKYISKQGGNEK